MTQLVKARSALPGAGTCLGVVAAAMEVLSTAFDFTGHGGTSGGGLVALALASGLKPATVSDVCSQMLKRKDLLDWQLQIPIVGSKTGAYKGAKVDGLLQDVFGQKRMGDLALPARVTASSMWVKRVGIVDSCAHADVLVWRAARATMNIEEVFELVRLRPDDARTYGDGGAGLNVPGGIWDDDPAVTVVVRFARQQAPYTLPQLIHVMDSGSYPEDAAPVRNEADVAAASFDILMDSSCAALPCRKSDANQLEVVLDCDGDSMKFGLGDAEVLSRRGAGAASARRALAQNADKIWRMRI